MTDYSDIIEREYLLSEIESFIERATLKQLRLLIEFIQNIPD